MSHSITDAEVRAVKSLCQQPELDTAQQIAAGPYGGSLSARHFAIALQGLRDKFVAYEEEGSWRLLPEARRELCNSEEPAKPRKEDASGEMLPQTPGASAEEDSVRGTRFTLSV